MRSSVGKSFNNGSTNIFSTQFYQALNNNSVQYRCNELTMLFDRGNIYDLQNIYPILINNIFDINGMLNWKLRSITSENNPADFQTLYDFLSPLGPLFRLIYRLIREARVTYDYPLSQLPVNIRSNLEIGNIPVFYNDLINCDLQTRKLISLKLNPFDYFIFSFGWHLISPWYHRPLGDFEWSALWQTVYYNLACEYLFHFLPLDNSAVLPIITSQYVGKNSNIIMTKQLPTKSNRISKLFRPQVIQQVMTDIDNFSETIQHPHSEIWRSETVLNVFIDMWLSCDQFTNPSNTHLSFIKPMNDLPCGEYIRLLRVFVKQLHAFAASAKNDLTAMSELKKICTMMFQNKMYAFLRHLMHRWPLDGSFRLLLELWLSFIQPWRYTKDKQNRNFSMNLNGVQNNAAMLNSNSELTSEYFKFVANNLLAYTVIFQQLLPRFLRVDLACPINAVMIYRVFKVFSQPNLVDMLKEIESSIVNINHSPSHSLWTSTLPPLSTTSCWSTTNRQLNTSRYSNNSISPQSPYRNTQELYTNSTDCDSQIQSNSPNQTTRWSAIVRQQIYELEGSDFCYKPLFNFKAPAAEIFELLKNLKQCYQYIEQLLEIQKQKYEEECKGLIGYIKSIFVGNTDGVSDERQKVPIYLELSYKYLATIFNIDVNELTAEEDTAVEHSNGSLIHSTNQNLIFNTLVANRSKNDIIQRIRNLKYEGDPELEPIRSDEISILVKLFFILTSKLNQKYETQINRIYHSTNFIGTFARTALIQTPRIIYAYEKSSYGQISKRVQHILQPRISFRYLASQHFLIRFFLSLIFFKFYDFNLTTTLVLMFVLWVLYNCVKICFNDFTLFKNWFVPNAATTRQSTNLNDSMDNTF